MLPDCSGTGRARGAEYSVFARHGRGGTSGSGKISQPFYAICNGKYAKHQEIALLVSKLSAQGSGASALRPNPAERGRSLTNPHRQTNAARALSQNRLSEPRLTVRHEYLALVDYVTCQVGGLNFCGLELLRVNGERVLVQDYQIGVFAGLQAAEVLLVTRCIGAAQGVVAQGCCCIDALARQPATLGPVAFGVLARDSPCRARSCW